MAGPWEQYQQAAPAAAGPWSNYQNGGIPTGPRKLTRDELIAQIPTEPGANLATAAPERKLGIIEQVVSAPLTAATVATSGPAYLAGRWGEALFGKKVGESVQQALTFPTYMEAQARQLEAVGRAGDALHLPPTLGGAGIPINALTGPAAAQAVNALGKTAETFVQQPLAQRAARVAQQRSEAAWARAPQIEAAQAAQRLGVAINPAEANPTVGTKLLVNATGEAVVNAKAAKANAPKWNEIARKDLGLPDNTPLTPEAFEKARAAHFAPYDEIRKIGTMQAPDEVVGQLSSLKLDPLSTSSPEKAAKVNAVVDRTISQISEGLSGENVVGQIRGFRKDATRVLQNPNATPIDIDVAEAQLGIANALENLVEANIANPKALDKFRAARTAIAKTYDWERATGVTTKQVDPAQIVKLAEKGKALSGTLADVANVAGNFPEIANLSPAKEPLLYQRLRRGGAGGTVGFALGGGPVGAAIGAGLTSLGSEATANLLTRPGVQNRLAVPRDYRIPLPVEQPAPMAPIPPSRAVVPYDYSQQAFMPPNFVMVGEQYGPRVGPAPTPASVINALPAPSAEGTINALRAEDARRAAVSRSLGQQAEARAAAAEAAGRRPTSGEVILDFDPITGRFREASQGLKGATPETFSNFGSALETASNKVTEGKRFDMTAAEKVAWEKTKVDLAEVAPGFNSLSDKAIAEKMMDRAWVTDTLKKAQEKARAFEQIAARAADERARQTALANRERMLDLADQMEESLRMARPDVSGKQQGPKTRAAQRNKLNMLSDQDVLNKLLEK